MKRTHKATQQYSAQKTNYLFRKGHSIKQIAQERNLKESTIYEHLAKLIEHSQTSVHAILDRNKIQLIKKNICNETDTLKEIKQRINNQINSEKNISYNEINLVLASIKAKNKKKNIIFQVKRYQKIKCENKCRRNHQQRKICKEKLNEFIKDNLQLELKRKQFANILKNISICTNL